MPGRPKGSYRLICPNQSCINKSVVYRKFDVLKEHRCKNCSWLLTSAESHKTKLMVHQNQKAKDELKELGNV